MKKFLIALCGVALIGVCGVFAVRYTRRVNASLQAPPAGASVEFVKNPVAVPDLVLKTLDGRTLNSRDWKGKVTLVNFWATWCPPCREEIPDLIKLQHRYKDQLQIIGVSSDEGPVEEVAKFVAEHRMNYAIVMETPE